MPIKLILHKISFFFSYEISSTKFLNYEFLFTTLKQHAILKSLYLHQTFSFKSYSKIIISKVNDLFFKVECIMKIDHLLNFHF